MQHFQYVLALNTTALDCLFNMPLIYLCELVLFRGTERRGVMRIDILEQGETLVRTGLMILDKQDGPIYMDNVATN